MLPLRVRGTRLLGRVTRNSLSKTQVRNFYSRKDTSPAINKTWRSFAITGLVSAPGFWWLTATHDDDVPRLEASPAGHLVAEPGPSKDEVTRIISKDAYSFPVKSVAGVNRYDGTQLASNSLCEDRFTHGIFPSPLNDGAQWMAWAVFDGHAGWQTAELLKDQLLPFVRHSLGQVKSASSEEGSIPDEVVHHAITKAFVDLDDSIIKTALQTVQSSEPLQDKLKKLAPAYAGSCALLSLYDSVTSSLHVACTGDSRAVLGQQLPDGKWEAIPLSVDQTGSNEDEVARINQEHPGEKNIAKDGRILGMMVSRAFGDSRWKWALELQQDLKERYDVRTPPYLTAEPVVTTTKIDPSKPSFVILATDGMWDTLSNQQAVDLVGKWLDAQIHGHPNSQPKAEYKSVDFGDLGNGVDWEFEEGRTTIQDDNVAVHLVRNSLGGNHHELIAGRLALGSPFSRRIRDDMTVQVVFFHCPRLPPK
ncbi:pyruvate dehydrogenase [Aspergillus nomiae NRRL 13137]|uniref:Pyruvate dehydrogenase n=1 Tax=Aspergillus nomiae NRRL (strain ATCC 15546 / NRRL 13137 / CBS 260.88 / M93) TaxID=1509407 RepID=A0A0L1J6Y2_ASPN3|nr:pyruvate dehydrogenase [Aspergillus nomiae NRRL 13137]KNG87183.1 pyruvate dehydrogenase [Aspergillus nomiae NRRL 13137]